MGFHTRVAGLALWLASFLAGQALASVSFSSPTFQYQTGALQGFRLDAKTLLTGTPSGTLIWGVGADKPAWLQMDTSTGVLSGTPALSDIGTKSFRLSVKDNDAGGLAQIIIKVVAVPQWASDPLDLGTQKEGQAFTLDLNTKVTVPAGGGNVTFVSQGLPAWLS